MRLVLTAVFLLTTLPAVAGAPPAITKIEYHYGDSSVPPRYHRSYVITATPTAVRKVVDSYGKLISDKTRKLKKKEWRELIATLKAAKLRKKKANDKRPRCAGSRSHRAVVWRGKNKSLDASVSPCNDRLIGTLRGDYKSFRKTMDALAP